jgi:hypothetical protein
VSSPAFTPKLAGTYRWVVSYSGDANNAAVAGGCNDVGESTVVSKATPKLATAASPTITLGSGVLTDAATVSGLVSPQASATIDFRLYGPRDPTCAAAPVFQSLGIRLPVSGGRVTTAAFTPTAAGTSRWVASYSGDANNAPMAGACNVPGETAVVAVTAAPTQLSHLKCYGARKAWFAPKSVLLRDQFMQTRSVVTKVTQIWNPVRKNGGKIVHSRPIWSATRRATSARRTSARAPCV